MPMPPRKAPLKAPTSSAEAPQVGIFWVFNGRLLKASSSLERGIASPEFVDSRYEHVNFWPVLQIRVPELRALQYEEVPRGRVLFKKSSGRFCVYMDKSLHTAKVKSMIQEVFVLPISQTSFLTDPHYTTDHKDLDRLFAED